MNTQYAAVVVIVEMKIIVSLQTAEDNIKIFDTLMHALRT